MTIEIHAKQVQAYSNLFLSKNINKSLKVYLCNFTSYPSQQADIKIKCTFFKNHSSLDKPVAVI